MRSRGLLLFLFVAVAAFDCGCQHQMVRDGAKRLTSTVSDLYYEEVLDNLAMTIVKPDALPYFGVPTQATHTNARQVQAGYTGEWDLITAAGALFGRTLFAKQTAPFAAQMQNQENMQLQPISNPDRLFLMQVAYKTAAELLDDETERDILRKYYDQNKFYIDYKSFVQPGWFCVTTDKKEVRRARKDGCCIGCYDGTYVYVTPDNADHLSRFTLAILDIATLDTDYFYGEKPGSKRPSATAEPTPGATTPEDKFPKRIKPFPFPPPPVAPSL